jgi:hypothetical protein
MNESSFNPSRRRLCADGACVGVVDDDGRCRVCGMASDGTLAEVPSVVLEHDDDEPTSDFVAGARGVSAGDDDVVPDVFAQNGAGRGDLGFRPDRRLCDDGSCVGIIGDSGVCSVCGRPGGS